MWVLCYTCHMFWVLLFPKNSVFSKTFPVFLLMPTSKEMVETIMVSDAASKIPEISLCVTQLVTKYGDMYTERIGSSQKFSIQIDKSIVTNGHTQLLAYIHTLIEM